MLYSIYRFLYKVIIKTNKQNNANIGFEKQILDVA